MSSHNHQPRYFVVGEDNDDDSGEQSSSSNFFKSKSETPSLSESKPWMYSWRSLSSQKPADGVIPSAILDQKAEREKRELSARRNNYATAGGGTSFTGNSNVYSPSLHSTVSSPARHRRPSIKPLENTLTDIMSDTTPPSSQQQLLSGTSAHSALIAYNRNYRNKDISEESGSKSIYVSHSPAADSRKVEMERTLRSPSAMSALNSPSSRANNGFSPSSLSSMQQQQTFYSVSQKRVGVVYSHPSAFSHLETSRGTKNFIVNTPISIEEMTKTASNELQLHSNDNDVDDDENQNEENERPSTQKSIIIRLGYWGNDGVTPKFFQDDYQLQRYLSDQPKVVPFCQVFVVDPEDQDKLAKTDNVDQILREKSQRQQQRRSHQSNSNYRQQTSTPSMFTPIPEMKIESRPLSAHQGRQHQGEEKQSDKINNTTTVQDINFVGDDDKTRVVKDPNSERGLRVVPPQSNTPGSVRSAWRMNIDSTIENTPASGRYTSASRSSNYTNTDNNNHHHHHYATSSPNPYQPLYSRPQRRLSSCSLVKTTTPMPNEFVNFDSSLNEKAVEAVFQRLAMMNDNRSRSNTNNDATIDETESGGGVRPLDFLDYLDVAFDNFGDRRRFERLIGPKLMVKEQLNKDEVALVLMRLCSLFLLQICTYLTTEEELTHNPKLNTTTSSFLEKTFADLADQPEIIFAVLGTSREIMNCSAVPVILSTDETWDLLCSKQWKTEEKLLQLFSTFSDTMQFTEKLRVQNYDADFVKGILENLINNKRYFTRTIRLLQLPSADALVEACCSLPSTTTTTPILFSNLRSLCIGGSIELQNEQLKIICSRCPFLEKLTIRGQHAFTEEGVEFLLSLRNLKTLDLESCDQITDVGLAHLAKLSSLRSLILQYCNKITNDDGLEQLAKLSSLQSLNLCYSTITDTGLQHLAKLSSLRSLNLHGCNITDSGLEHLAKLPSLESLNLRHCQKITDTGLQQLAKLSSLLWLDLNNCQLVTDSGLQDLSRLRFLQSLNLGYCGNITDAGIQYLSRLSSLQSLNLGYCGNITDAGIQYLSRLSSLQSLNLDFCKLITDSGLQHLSKLSSLQTLNLSFCKLITDGGLQHLSKLSSLQTLNIEYCTGITDDECHVFSASTRVYS